MTGSGPSGLDVLDCSCVISGLRGSRLITLLLVVLALEMMARVDIAAGINEIRPVKRHYIPLFLKHPSYKGLPCCTMIWINFENAMRRSSPRQPGRLVVPSEQS
jgi:hypothetical protein